MRTSSSCRFSSSVRVTREDGIWFLLCSCLLSDDDLDEEQQEEEERWAEVADLVGDLLWLRLRLLDRLFFILFLLLALEKKLVPLVLLSETETGSTCSRRWSSSQESSDLRGGINLR